MALLRMGVMGAAHVDPSGHPRPSAAISEFPSREIGPAHCDPPLLSPKRSALQEQREPAKCKCWRRRQERRRIASQNACRRHGRCPLRREDFGMSRFKGSSGNCTIFPARLKASRCPQGLRRLSASWKTEFRLRNLVRAARVSGRDGWPVIAIAWLGVRRVNRPMPMKVANASRRR
jgi:hypothetical protein